MTYTDSQILDLIDDLHSVGQTEEPKEELKRLLREWEIEVGVHKIQEKSPKEKSGSSREFATWCSIKTTPQTLELDLC